MLNQEAENMDFGAWNTTKRIFSLGFAGNSQNDKTNLMARSNALHMEATRELAAIQQQTLSFVCLSIAFSYAINKALEDIVKNGFKDVDGNIVKLTGATAKIVEQMDTQAKENIKRHEAKEEELKQMKAQIAAMKSNNKNKMLFAFAVIAIILICAILIVVTVLK